MKAFEIHTFQGGKWKIDSIFDDRDLAMFEAQRIDSSNRYSGVRVVEEVFDESSEQTSVKTIFRGGRGLEQRALKDAPDAGKSGPRPAARRPAAAAGRARGGRRRPPPRKQKGFAGPLVVLFFVVLLGGAALYGLQYFQGLH